MRRRIIAANWKLHRTATEAADFMPRLTAAARAIGAGGSTDAVEIILAPPFTALQAVTQTAVPDFPFTLAAQNLFWEDQGAFTGEVSAPMLTDLGCRAVILGHSERRRLFGDTDEQINKRIRAAFRHGLRPILCLGESLAEREAGRTDSVVTAQLTACLAGCSTADLAQIVIAYEPVWAIGTGRAATPDQAAAVHDRLRTAAATGWGDTAGQQLRILYGGSVTPDNIGSFLASPQIDGALVGGACLDPHSFAMILSLAQKLRT